MRKAVLAILSAASLVFAGGALRAQVVTYSFEWQGAGGYTMRGGLSFDAGLTGARPVLESDIACFAIEGFRDGASIGRWGLGMRSEQTTWQLTFDPVLEEFVVWGPEAPMPQAWNMDGEGRNCGAGGFGFNIGDAAQDLCLNGELLRDSQVEPARPFPARRNDGYVFPPNACTGDVLLSSLTGR